MPTLDEIRSIVRDEIRAIVDPEGYRAGQQRIRENYMRMLQDQLADFDVIDRDKAIPDEAREPALIRMGESMRTLKSRIDDLDRELALGENGNRAARRRKKK